MARKKREPLDELVELAVAAPTRTERQSIAAKARKLVIPKVKKKLGAPSQYSEAKAETILNAIANGKTLTRICESMNITPESIYGWLRKYPDFNERYYIARESMGRTLIDRMLDENETIEPERANAAKVRAQVLQWAISRFNPREFSDSKRIQLSGEITHTHAHQLEDHQKRKIAEAWLMSKQLDDSPGIVSTTTGPDLEGVSVIDEPARELPKRKKPALPAKMKASPGHDDSSNTRWRGKNDEDAD